MKYFIYRGRKVDNKEKVLIGAVSFLAGAAVGFLLAPVKKIVSFEKFSCNNIEDSEVDSSLETSEDNKVDKDEEKEASLLNEWVMQLPEPFVSEMQELYREMEERKTLEARIYKALDNLEALIQHNESDISTWIPLEYDLQMTYGNDKVQFSEYLTRLRDEVRNDSKKKIAESIKKSD